MTAALQKKYTPEVIKSVRKKFDRDYDNWKDIQTEANLDMQCISTERGPWPEAEWRARHEAGNERPCLHEDVLSQFGDKVINDIQMNPMGVSVTPQDGDANQDTAEHREGRIRHLEYEQNANYAIQEAAKNAVWRSYGFWKLETYYDGKVKDDSLQQVCIEPIMDPDSIIPGYSKKPDWSDMRDCWEREKMSHEEFAQRWPKAQIKSFSGLIRDDTSGRWFDDKEVVVAAWWHLEEDERELLTMDDGSEKGVPVYRDEVDEVDETKVRKITKETQRKVIKTIFNGVEALEETTWIDEGDDIHPPEIPVLVVTGRVKYQQGKRSIESLIRKGRTGQLLYDATISNIQERVSLVPKVKLMGYEGQFGSSTDFRNIHRSPTGYIEVVAVPDPTTGQILQRPEFIDIPAGTAELEQTKQSILIGIQNAIGMSSTERKDRASKSGKALDKLAEEMNVSTAHYFNSVRIAQERMYRILNRILAKVDAGKERLPVRSADGKTTMVAYDENLYKGSHAVVIGSGKLYQSMQDEQSDFADSLLKIQDPGLQMIVLPDVIRMKGIGEEGKKLARMIEALQPPQVQQAREGKTGTDPMVQQVMTQAQQQLQALDAHAKQVESERDQLLFEKKAQIVQKQYDKEMREEDNKTKIYIAEINASVKERMDVLDAQVAHIKNVADVLMSQVGIAHEATQADADRAQESTEAGLDRTHEAVQSDADRAHATDLQDRAAEAAKEQAQAEQPAETGA